MKSASTHIYSMSEIPDHKGFDALLLESFKKMGFETRGASTDIDFSEIRVQAKGGAVSASFSGLYSATIYWNKPVELSQPVDFAIFKVPPGMTPESFFAAHFKGGRIDEAEGGEVNISKPVPKGRAPGLVSVYVDTAKFQSHQWPRSLAEKALLVPPAGRRASKRASMAVERVAQRFLHSRS